MEIREVMSGDVQVVSPHDTIGKAAAKVKEIDAGALPVAEADKLVGMVTDRDIAVRAVAEGKGPDAKVRDVMTPEVKYVFEDQDVADVAANTAELQVRRLPVVSREKRRVGIVSLGDLATEGSVPKSARALHGISQPGGQHSQSGAGAHAGDNISRSRRSRDLQGLALMRHERIASFSNMSSTIVRPSATPTGAPAPARIPVFGITTSLSLASVIILFMCGSPMGASCPDEVARLAEQHRLQIPQQNTGTRGGETMGVELEPAARRRRNREDSVRPIRCRCRGRRR
jgi:CBS domain-containing protein